MIRVLVVALLSAAIAFGSASFATAVYARRPVSVTIIPVPAPCGFYRFKNGRDSAYFQVSCKKPLPDSIILVPAGVP